MHMYLLRRNRIRTAVNSFFIQNQIYTGVTVERGQFILTNEEHYCETDM